MLGVLFGSRMYSVLTFGLTLMFLFSIPLRIESQGMFAPQVDSVRIGTSANATDTNPMTLLTAATSTSFHVNGTVSDLDGWSEISTVTAKLFRSDKNWWCTDDKNDCYSHPSCTFSNSTGTTRDYNCEIEVDYFADPTDAGSENASQTWMAYITVTDTFFWQGTGSSTNEMSSLLAIQTDGEGIHYGTMDANDVSSSSESLTITNKGNVAADVEISSAGMTCESGSVAASQQKFDTLDRAYSTMTYTLSGVAQAASLTLPQQTNDFFPITDELFWRIQIPGSGAGGSCSGTTEVIAITP